MNSCSFEDYFVNSDNWNYHSQIEYSHPQVDFVELANVQENIPAVNSSLVYDGPYPSNCEKKDLFIHQRFPTIVNVNSPKYQW